MAFTYSARSNNIAGYAAASFTPAATGGVFASDNYIALLGVVHAAATTATGSAKWHKLFTYVGTSHMAGHAVTYFWRRFNIRSMTPPTFDTISLAPASDYEYHLTFWTDSFPDTYADYEVIASTTNITSSLSKRLTTAGTFPATWVPGLRITVAGFQGGLASIDGNYKIEAVDAGFTWIELVNLDGTAVSFPAGTESTAGAYILFDIDGDQHPFGNILDVVYNVEENTHATGGDLTLYWPELTTKGYGYIYVGWFSYPGSTGRSVNSPTTSGGGITWAGVAYPGATGNNTYRGNGWFSTADAGPRTMAAGSTYSTVSGTVTAAFAVSIGIHRDQPPRAPEELAASCVVVSLPVAGYTFTPAAPKAGQTITFTNASNGAPTSWLWDFGDGTTSTLESPTHVYSRPGVYRVTLVSTNSTGSSVPFSYVIVVAETASAYEFILPPVADFEFSPNYGERAGGSITITFTDRSLMTGNTYHWDFGDGGSSTSQSPTHDYTNEGLWTVRLTVTDDAGDTSTCTRQVYVKDGADADNSPPVIQIDTVSANRDYKPLTVAFTSSCDVDPETVEWSFGDGEFGTGASPSHTYTNEGTYTVIAIAANQNGYSTASIEIQVLGTIKMSVVGGLWRHVLFPWRNVGHSYDDSWMLIHTFGHGPDDDPGELNTPKNIVSVVPNVS